MSRLFVQQNSYLKSQSTNSENDYDYVEMDCCPLVVDPYIVLALFTFIGAATYLLQTVIEMSMLGRRRKRSLSDYLIGICMEGKNVNKN